MIEAEIIQAACDNLKEKTGLEAYWEGFDYNDDARLNISINDSSLYFSIEVKKEVRPHHLQAILNQKQLKSDLIIIAEKILPKAKSQLRELSIPYIETSGNIFLNERDKLLWIDTNRPSKLKKETGNRAFSKTGLKVIFHFFLDRDRINDPQRLIAKETGVGLGSIPQILEGLKKSGYIYSINKDTYAWTGRRQLLERWITEYETKLKPSLFLARYTFNGNHQRIQLQENHSVWGGEFAADFLTNHIRPIEYTIYTKETRHDLIAKYKLVPKNEGEIFVYKWFWHENTSRFNIAPPLLIYADLMIQGDKRSRETAQMIFDEHLVTSI